MFGTQLRSGSLLILAPRLAAGPQPGRQEATRLHPSAPVELPQSLVYLVIRSSFPGQPLTPAVIFVLCHGTDGSPPGDATRILNNFSPFRRKLCIWHKGSLGAGSAGQLGPSCTGRLKAPSWLLCHLMPVARDGALRAGTVPCLPDCATASLFAMPILVPILRSVTC